MRISKERVLPIRLIRKGHLLPQCFPFPILHRRQHLVLPLVQPPVVQPQHYNHETTRGQTRHNANLPARIPGRLVAPESLRPKHVARAKGDQGQRVHRHLLAVAGDVGGIPREVDHEAGAEGAGEERGGEQGGLVVRGAGGVDEAVHEGGGEDGGDEAEQHDGGAVVPAVREVAGAEDEDDADGAVGGVEDEGLLVGVAAAWRGGN